MRNSMLFCIFPYLTSIEPVTICGIPFYPSQKLDANSRLSEDARSHLETLFSLFCDGQGEPIEKMLYTFVDFEGEKLDSVILRNLEYGRLLLAYMYLIPDDSGYIFPNYENFDMYLFYPSKVIRSLKGNSIAENAENNQNLGDELMDGYEGGRNFNKYVTIANNQKIFPSDLDTILPIQRDVDVYLERMSHINSNWIYNNILLRGGDIEAKIITDKLFFAIGWYNRSCSLNITLDLSFLYLAIALESLLGLQNTSDKKARLKDFILALLGNEERIAKWIDAFYETRSSIVHGGYSSEYSYKIKLGTKQHDKPIEHGLLISYGYRIFRLCLSAILGARLRAHDQSLYSSFFHKKEHLEEIIKILNDLDLQPAKKFYDIADNVYALNQHRLSFQDEIYFDTVLNGAKKLSQTYLDIFPEEQSSDFRLNLMAVINGCESILDHHQEQRRGAIWHRLRTIFDYRTLDGQSSKVIEAILESTQLKLLDGCNQLKTLTSTQLNGTKLDAIIRLMENIDVLERLEAVQAWTRYVHHFTYVSKREPESVISLYSQYVDSIIFQYKTDWFEVNWES